MAAIRGDRRGSNGAEYGLRLWENEDIVPRPDDVFQERLYCIRWVHTWIENGKERTERYYRAPTGADQARERKVLELLRERFDEWQRLGYIPSRRIEPGDKTTRRCGSEAGRIGITCLRRGSCWVTDSFAENRHDPWRCQEQEVDGLFGVGRCCKLGQQACARWDSRAARESIPQTFYNQALNTLGTTRQRAFPAVSICRLCHDAKPSGAA